MNENFFKDLLSCATNTIYYTTPFKMRKYKPSVVLVWVYYIQLYILIYTDIPIRGHILPEHEEEWNSEVLMSQLHGKLTKTIILSSMFWHWPLQH